MELLLPEYRRSLPPGLILPDKGQSTEQYLKENFRRPDRPYEDILGYGAFMVALIVWDAIESGSGRVSYMPTYEDVDNCNKAGYGMNREYLRVNYSDPAQRRNYLGHTRLNVAMGFCPDEFVPTRPWLLARFRWMAEHALDPTTDLERQNITAILDWGRARRLISHHAIVRSVLGGTTTEVGRIFGVEKLDAKKQLTYRDVYRFGARVIRENDGPVTAQTLNRQYADVFDETPVAIIRAFFGPSLLTFWLEFDYVSASAVSRQQLTTLGVRRAIATGEPELTSDQANHLSRQRRFFSAEPIYHHFKTIEAFNHAVAQEYVVYEQLRNELVTAGVSDELVRLSCRKFEATSAFLGKLKINRQALVLLSTQSTDARLVLSHIREGFDLEDDQNFKIQHRRLASAMRHLGLTYAERTFVYERIPYINVDEMLGEQ